MRLIRVRNRDAFLFLEISMLLEVSASAVSSFGFFCLLRYRRSDVCGSYLTWKKKKKTRVHISKRSIFHAIRDSQVGIVYYLGRAASNLAFDLVNNHQSFHCRRLIWTA